MKFMRRLSPGERRPAGSGSPGFPGRSSIERTPWPSLASGSPVELAAQPARMMLSQAVDRYGAQPRPPRDNQDMGDSPEDGIGARWGGTVRPGSPTARAAPTAARLATSSRPSSRGSQSAAVG